MSQNTIFLSFVIFESIHISQQGAVFYGSGRSASFDCCIFNDIITSSGGSCIDLSSSLSLVSSSNCFSSCKNTNINNDEFANIIKYIGDLANFSMCSSFLCADSVKSGDSSIFAQASQLSMCDNNATSNSNPEGASSLRTISASNQKMSLVKRSIDANSALYTSFEIFCLVEISYTSVINTTKDWYVIIGDQMHLKWCCFTKQCSSFNFYKLLSSSFCYTDKERPELMQTTSSFDIFFPKLGLEDCQNRIHKKLQKCLSTDYHHHFFFICFFLNIFS